MKSGQKKGKGQGGVLICVAVLLLGGLGLMYSYGAGQAKAEGMKTSYHLKHAHSVARDMLAECRRESDKKMMESSSVDAQPFSERNKRIEEENEGLYKQNQDWEARNAKCSEQLFRLNEKKGDLQLMADKIKTLEATSKDLVEKTNRLTGMKGMRSILLRYNLKRLTGEMNKLRAELDMSEVRTTDEFLDELVAKWKLLNSTRMTVGQTIRPVHDDERTLLPVSPYDPDTDAAHVFWPQKTVDGEYIIPGWQGRYGTQDLRHGTFIGSTYQPITDIDKQMRMLYNYAICAVGLNITKFMYPSLFKSCKDCPTEYLHQFVETPLLLFCDDCVPQHHTNEFKMLCRGLFDQDQYGSALFWRARSRLRFKGKYALAAEKWMAENEFGKGNPTLAVRIPRSEDFLSSCGTKKLTMCYRYLLQGKVRELSAGADKDFACKPSLEHIAEAINKFATDHPGLQVYVSTDSTEQELTELQDQVNVKLHRRHATGHLSEDSIVDTFICALSDYIVANRYERKSTLVTEAFMLQHNLRITNISVW